ncbi:MAG: tripartite tricarboxylate transporter TctB family protein [Rhizobiaceae bacterium]|nr:tripartite tricarboxylate transporter TctB family protein [Rhizobiaceae bacterium]
MNRKDLLSGGIFIAASLFFGTTALMTLPLGTPEDMGPGFFPVCLSIVLCLFGIAIFLRGAKDPLARIGHVPWRPVLIILAAPILFGLTALSLGLAVSVALTVALSLLAGQRQSIATALAITFGLTVFSVALFHYGLRLPIPLWPV